MTTQDPYRDLSQLRNRREYPGYDEFVPYRNDWHYGFGLFVLVALVAVTFAYWQVMPDRVPPVTKLKNVKVEAKAPAASIPDALLKQSTATGIESAVKDVKNATPPPVKNRPVLTQPVPVQEPLDSTPFKPVTAPKTQ